MFQVFGARSYIDNPSRHATIWVHGKVCTLRESLAGLVGIAILLTMAVLAMAIPSLFSHSIGPDTSVEVEALSLGVAGVMIVLYGLGLFFSLRMPSSPLATAKCSVT